MSEKKAKILLHSSPGISYYLPAIFFPVMFFLLDDSRQILFESWDRSLKTYIVNSLVLFLCWGVPFLMIILRREMTVYHDKVEVHRPVIKSLKTYYFTDLVKWNVSDVYIHKAGRQINLILKFKNGKLTFHKTELSNFAALVHILETAHIEKKKI